MELYRLFAPAFVEWVHNPPVAPEEMDILDRLSLDKRFDPSWPGKSLIGVLRDLFESDALISLLLRGALSGGRPADLPGIGSGAADVDARHRPAGGVRQSRCPQHGARRGQDLPGERGEALHEAPGGQGDRRKWKSDRDTACRRDGNQGEEAGAEHPGSLLPLFPPDRQGALRRGTPEPRRKAGAQIHGHRLFPLGVQREAEVHRRRRQPGHQRNGRHLPDPQGPGSDDPGEQAPVVRRRPHGPHAGGLRLRRRSAEVSGGEIRRPRPNSSPWRETCSAKTSGTITPKPTPRTSSGTGSISLRT